MKLVSIFGMTSVGKTTLLDAMRDVPWVGQIRVGEEMKRRHSAEYFEGQAAMDKTEDEVWEIFDEQYQYCKKRGDKVVLCDGQPRMVSQVPKMVKHRNLSIIWLHCNTAALIKRAETRGEWGQLSLDRMNNDRIQLLDVIHSLTTRNIPILSIDTSIVNWISQAQLFVDSYVY